MMKGHIRANAESQFFLAHDAAYATECDCTYTEELLEAVTQHEAVACRVKHIKARAAKDVFFEQTRLIYKLHPGVEIILVEEIRRRFEQVSIRVSMQFVIAAPDQTRRPVAVIPRSVVGDRGRHPLEVAGFDRFWMNQMTERELHRPVRCRREPNSSAPGIELTHLNILAVLVGLRAVKQRAFNAKAPGCYSGCNHAMSNMRRVLPVMSKRRRGILRRRHSVHERRRPQRRLSNRTTVKVQRD